MSSNLKPEVYDFKDGTRWLGAWLAWWQSGAKSPKQRSLGALANRCGVGKSTLSQVFAESRKPSREALLKYNKVLELDLDRIEYLCLLFDRDRAKTHGERLEFVAAIERRRREHEADTRPPISAGYISLWENLAIREVARVTPVPDDPDRLIQLLPPYLELDRDVVAHSLAWLREQGLLVRDTDGMLHAEREAFETGPTVDGARAIHRRALEQAERAIAAIPYDRRGLGLATVAIRSSELPALFEEWWAFQERVRDLADSTGTPDSVFQLTVQLLPILLPP